jgi:sulfite exporter TauE/SafE
VLTLLTGSLAGVFHVLSGPDHLAAVAALAVDDQRRGWFSGWTWGIGHASGVVLVAVMAVLLRDLLPPIEVISHWSERLVGAALIAIGLWALRRSARIAPVRHAHGTVSHQHLQVTMGPRWARRFGHAHTSFCLGVLHGVAGSSHFFGVLPALALPSRTAALLYIAAFGLGTVAAMTAFAAVIGSAGARRRHDPRLHRAMMASAAMLAIVVGGIWLT